MDSLITLLVLAVLGVPAAAIIALVVALNQRTRLRILEARVAALEAEAAIAAGRPLTQAPAAPLQPPGERFPQQRWPGWHVPSAPPPVREASPVPPQEPEPQAQPIPGVANAAATGPALPAPPPLPSLKDRLAGFEEKIGARWAVWVGGLALALGGVFLVRFAVEQDLIGPAARIGLGLTLAAALLATGEWLRRKERDDTFAPTLSTQEASTEPGPSAGPPEQAGALALARSIASVPAMLTAAGTMTAFGTIFAAYSLYGLISPPVAFIALAATGIATLLAALLHGPALAALGFVGAAVTPFLISSDEPNAWSVALLIAVVGGSALGVARVRLWRWLALLAIAGMVAWGLTLIVFEVPQALSASGGLALALLAFTAALLAPGLLFGPEDDGHVDLVSTLGAVGAMAVVTAAAVIGASGVVPVSLFAIAALATLALAFAAPASTYAAVAVALAVPAVLATWAFPPDAGSTLVPGGPMAGVVPEPARLSIGHFTAFAAAMGAAMLGLGLIGARRARRALLALGWAAAGGGGPILVLVAAYARLTELDRSLAFAALGLALAAVFTLAAEWLTRERRTPAAAGFAAAGVVSLGLALAFALEKGWLTVGLALAALGVAWVATARPLPGLRQLSAGLGLVVLARVMWEPTIAGTDLGTMPILNWLLWGYGVPALAFAGAAWLLGRDGTDDWARKALESLALVFAVLLAAFEVRHLAHGGDVYAYGARLFEIGLLASIYGAYAVGLSRLAAVTGRGIHRLFADLAATIAGICALNGLIEGNPFSTGESVGGLVFNDLLVAYALPAALALLYAAALPAARGRLKLVAQGFALVLALAYVTLMVSRAFQGPVLSEADISASEWYAWSAAWLTAGIVLLGIGLWRGSRALRLASGAVMVASVLKVFLSDMADLEGVLRAASFIGLGIVLVAMGWLYQRLLARGAPRPVPDAESGAPQ